MREGGWSREVTQRERPVAKSIAGVNMRLTAGGWPVSMPHSVENMGDEPLRFLELFRAERFVDISLAQWMALTPHEVLQVHLDLPSHMIDTMRKAKQPAV
jgi:oxalate decarboxylase